MANIGGRKKAGETVAAYESNGTTMKASVKALHVLLCQEDGTWSAQGVEIDYAASGENEQKAIHNFVEGLALTVAQHLVIHGHLEKVLAFAPKEVLTEWLKMSPKKIQSVDFKATVEAFQEANVPQEKALDFPFDGFAFVRPGKLETATA